MPCPKSLKQVAWLNAERKAGHPLPDFQWQARTEPVYVCGSADDVVSPGCGHYEWHRYRNQKPCLKSMAEKAWYQAEVRAGCSLPDYQPFSRPARNIRPAETKRSARTYICGDADEATSPDGSHYEWHRRHKTPACDKSKKERAWYQAELKAGHPLFDYQWQARNDCASNYVCGPADEATGPYVSHYRWHRRQGINACGKSKAEAAWYYAEARAGHSLPDYIITRETRKETNYVCGDADEATSPGFRHYMKHNNEGTSPCPKSLKQYAWYYAEVRAGCSLPDYQWKLNNIKDYVCGTADTATRPDTSHYEWHRRHKTPACDKSKAENAWHYAEYRAGHSLPDYQWKPRTKSDGYKCGTAEEATSPNGNHYAWHLNSKIKPCDKSKKEKAWYIAELKKGKPLPDYVYKGPLDWDVPTSVYQITFIDGDRYYGITALVDVEERVREHQKADSPVGDKIRSGVVFIAELLCVAPDRYKALEIEKMAIKSGNPHGSLLNRQHNQDNTLQEQEQGQG